MARQAQGVDRREPAGREDDTLLGTSPSPNPSLPNPSPNPYPDPNPNLKQAGLEAKLFDMGSDEERG